MTTYPHTVEGLSSALAALGGTPGQVADTLSTLGHRGNPGCDASCPVATYLTDLYPGASCSVNEEPPGKLAAEVWYSPTRNVTAAVPKAVHHFINRFDAGTHYTELNRHAEVA